MGQWFMNLTHEQQQQFERLVGDLFDGRLVLFVGAGYSTPSGIQSASTLTNQLLDKMRTNSS